MKKIKIVIDIIMFICMVLLMNTKITGLQTHEIMGVGIFIIFVIHKILNIKWIKAIGKNFKNRNLETKSKILFILDILLFIFIFANVITGILISKCILTTITIGNISFMTVFHKFLAWWSLILISIHLGFHWKSVVNYFSSKFKFLKDNIIVNVILKILYVIIAILGVISLLKKDIYTKLIPIVGNNKNLKEYHRDFDDINTDDRYKDKNMQDFDKERGNGRKNHNPNSNNESSNNKKDEDDSENNRNNDNNEKTDVITTISDTTSGGTPTLNEFLSKLNCTGCGKRCVLTNPQCGRGMSYKTEKVQEYNQLYGTNESSNSQEYDENLDNIPSFNEFDKKEKDNNISDITKANINGTSVIDYISIMGLLIGGTYYIIDIIDKQKNTNNSK